MSAFDVTPRQPTEAGLPPRNEMQEQLAAIAATVPGLIYSFRLCPDGSVSLPYASAILQDVFGLHPQDLQRDARPVLALIHPEDAPRFQTLMLESARTLAPWQDEFRVCHPQKGEIWVEGHSVPRRLEDGSTLWHGYVQDVTERKQLESQLRQAQKMEAVGRLAGGVAHDFNNILAATLLHLGVLRADPQLGPELQRSLGELEEYAQHAAKLTRQLLLFGRRTVMDVKSLDLNEVVEPLLQMLARLLGEHIRVEFDAQWPLPAIHADASMIEQVILNLAVNARDAMPKGGRLSMATGLREFSADPALPGNERRAGRFVCLSVADTGCGMDAETRAKIFEPFFTTKEVGQGTGLGLATVYSITQQHGGWIEVESETGQGSRFEVFFPANAQSPAEAAPDAVAWQAHGGTETILLVEDEASVRTMVKLTLERLGYSIYEASDAREALELWRQHGKRIALLFTDMVMPEGTSGLELAAQLRQERPDLRVIISSGYSAEMSERATPLEDGICFLPKPFQLPQLATTLRACLDPNPDHR